MNKREEDKKKGSKKEKNECVKDRTKKYRQIISSNSRDFNDCDFGTYFYVLKINGSVVCDGRSG